VDRQLADCAEDMGKPANISNRPPRYSNKAQIMRNVVAFPAPA
jgi:hypothetical protein